MITKLESLELIDFQQNCTDNSSLEVFEVGSGVPFAIKRVFTVHADKDTIRGNHAHKECSQLLVATTGKIEVEVQDKASNKKTFLLDKPNVGLLIPPLLWARQKYLEDNSTLMVFCDKPYAESDYVRSLADFINLG